MRVSHGAIVSSHRISAYLYPDSKIRSPCGTPKYTCELITSHVRAWPLTSASLWPNTASPKHPPQKTTNYRTWSLLCHNPWGRLKISGTKSSRPLKCVAPTTPGMPPYLKPGQTLSTLEAYRVRTLRCHIDICNKITITNTIKYKQSLS